MIRFFMFAAVFSVVTLLMIVLQPQDPQIGQITFSETVLTN